MSTVPIWLKQAKRRINGSNKTVNYCINYLYNLIMFKHRLKSQNAAHSGSIKGGN